MPTIGGFSQSQTNAMIFTERFNASVSVIAILFVIFTYIFARGFDKPINRLIFFASFGNLGSTIASLISAAGPFAGNNAPLCQFQAFLVQMFLGVDCYWAFCMSINVYLVFFRSYNTDQLRSLDLWYLFICYGLSFLPALIFLFIKTQHHGRIYGDALIWCWITTKWDYLRVVFLYGIVWLALIFAVVVYAMAGKVIWDKRRHLDGFLNPLNENPFVNLVTTEIEITYEDRPITTQDGVSRSDVREVDPYSVQIQTDSSQKIDKPLSSALRIRAATREAAERETNAEAWLYARVAFLFFFALIITWVPSSVNRVSALAHPKRVNFAMNYVASLVFPLQGFWNVVVYVLTSQSACRRLWNRTFSCWARRNGSADVILTGSMPEDRYTQPGKKLLRSFSSLDEQSHSSTHSSYPV